MKLGKKNAFRRDGSSWKKIIFKNTKEKYHPKPNYGIIGIISCLLFHLLFKKITFNPEILTENEQE